MITKLCSICKKKYGCQFMFVHTMGLLCKSCHITNLETYTEEDTNENIDWDFWKEHNPTGGSN